MVNSSPKHVVIIGANLAGLATAAYLARDGYEVTVLEKNKKLNNPDSLLTWYLMPPIFEEFFAAFGTSSDTYYKVTKLQPHYSMFLEDNVQYDLGSAGHNKTLFSQIEPGASVELEQFLELSRKLYELSLQPKSPSSAAKTLLLRNLYKLVSKQFQDERLRHMLEWISVVLGVLPKRLPGTYSGFTYADMVLGIWHPDGGMYKVAESFAQVAAWQGAKIRFGKKATSIEVVEGSIKAVRAGKEKIKCDIVVLATEDSVLKPEYRRTITNEHQQFALQIHLKLDTSLINLTHHNLFFDTDWQNHFLKLKNKQLNPEPLFFVDIPTKASDVSIFVPVADFDESSIDVIKHSVYQRIGERAQLDLQKHIVSENMTYHRYAAKTSGHEKFGFMQQATLRSNKVSNLFYTDRGNVPVIGAVRAVLSGKLVAQEIQR